MTAQENQAQRVYQITMNCNIHLGFNNEEEINQGLSVRAGNLPECCVRCITGIGRQTRLPVDKGLKTQRGLPLYTRRYGEHKSVLALSKAKRRTTTARFKDTGTRLQPRPLNMFRQISMLPQVNWIDFKVDLQLSFNFQALTNVLFQKLLNAKLHATIDNFVR